MRILVGLGGKALLQRGESPDTVVQLHHVRDAAQALAPLAAQHELVICHGDGPQAGASALGGAGAPSPGRAHPPASPGAQTEGMIGSWLAQCLHDAGVAKPVISVVTQTVVDPRDPAFARPAAFVGPGYSRRQAEDLAGRRGWSVAEDRGRWRRAVPSPQPRRIVEQDLITRLLRSGTVVICAGGGTPVVEDGDGRLRGVEAVVDKDSVSALLAINAGADRLLMLTDVAAVTADFGTPQAAPLRRLDLDALARLRFPAGSMGPKIAACRAFVEATGRSAAIGALADAAAVLAGSAGTTISGARTPDARPGSDGARESGCVEVITAGAE